MKHILCYGDSNTWGFQPGFGGRYPRLRRWTGVAEGLLGDMGTSSWRTASTGAPQTLMTRSCPIGMDARASLTPWCPRSPSIF